MCNKNSQEVSQNDIKKIEIDILKEIKSICETNHIRYYLAYGTLLGAVRHRGFIPWDDDIDIIIMRKDWDIFVDAFLKNASCRFRLLSYETSNKYCSPLAKVIDVRTYLKEDYYFVEKEDLGVYVDVFVADFLPNKKMERYLFFYEIKIIKKLWSLSDRQLKFKKSRIIKDFILNFFAIPFKIIGPRFFVKLLISVSQKYRNINSKYIGNLMYGVYGEKEILEYKFFGKGKLVEFENIRFTAPEMAEEYLKHIYGDYLKLPPIEKQVTHHAFKAVWR